MKPTPIFRQADRAWSAIRLGESRSSTIGRSGCLLTIYAQCLVDFDIDKTMTPALLQKRALEAHIVRTEKQKIFIGANIIQPRLAEFCGLTLGDLVRPPQPKSDVYRAIVTGLHFFGRVIVNVDHDEDKDGDHFILGRRIENNELVCADPATGAEERIDLTTFEGSARWGDEVKSYRLYSARPIGKTRV
jgi:hypothetical protein